MKLKARCPNCKSKIDIEISTAPRSRSKMERMKEKVDPLLGKEPDIAIAARCGVSTSTVTARRRRLGIPGYRLTLDLEREGEVVLLRRSGSTLEEIGLKMKITPERVRQLLKRAGEKPTYEKRTAK